MFVGPQSEIVYEIFRYLLLTHASPLSPSLFLQYRSYRVAWSKHLLDWQTKTSVPHETFARFNFVVDCP